MLSFTTDINTPVILSVILETTLSQIKNVSAIPYFHYLERTLLVVWELIAVSGDYERIDSLADLMRKGSTAKLHCISDIRNKFNPLEWYA